MMQSTYVDRFFIQESLKLLGALATFVLSILFISSVVTLPFSSLVLIPLSLILGLISGAYTGFKIYQLINPQTEAAAPVPAIEHLENQEPLSQQQLPQINYIEYLPQVMLSKINKFLSESDTGNLSSVSRGMHSLFQAEPLDKFLQRVAYGMQDKVEQLFTDVYRDKTAKVQYALQYQGRFTDYSGRRFNCTAYEYAYWAKDTHMCRMLERYMDAETKAFMAARIDEIERIDAATGQPVGLVYQQAGQEHRSAHFDFTPLKEAYQSYLAGFNAWLAANDWDTMDAAWLDVGKAQRNVPAHVAQEYCRPDRAFDPRPEFNEATLPRVLTFYNWTTHRRDSWFPLAASNSGLGFDFAWLGFAPPSHRGAGGAVHPQTAVADLVAVSRLDEVRTQLREHLNPPATSQSMSV